MLRADENLPDKMLFPHSRAALKGWGSRYPQCSRTGADQQIWFLIALHMLDTVPLLAAAVLVQLDTFARPSEILQVRKCDVIRPTSKHCRFWGIIFGNSERFDRTKTGLQDDTVLLDSTDRAFAKNLLQMLFNYTKNSQGRIFGNYTLQQYEAAMQRARVAAGLGSFQLTPHTVRHSGPSIDSLQKTRLPEEIMARGRWKTLKSIQRYQKPGQMLARMGKIDKEIWDKASEAVPEVLRRLQAFFHGGSAP